MSTLAYNWVEINDSVSRTKTHTERVSKLEEIFLKAATLDKKNYNINTNTNVKQNKLHLSVKLVGLQRCSVSSI